MTQAEDFAYGSVSDIGAALREGRVTAVAIAEASLARLDRLEPSLNAVIDPLRHLALDRAALADRELAAGFDRGPLHGIPVAIKDIIDIKGETTSFATRAVAPMLATEDADLVARLREAGAVFLGKTNLLEFAYGVAHPAIGQTNNPFDLGRTSGGSSGGSAALVAAGIVPLAVGTDTGGSIRIPAAYCGIVGYKPSYGFVSTKGVFPLSWSLDHAGPLARSTGDAALLLEAMTGVGITMSPPAIDRLRIGVVTQHLGSQLVASGVHAVVEAALARLGGSGATILEADFPEQELVMPGLVAVLLPEASLAHEALPSADRSGYAPGTLRQIDAGRSVPGIDYVRAQRLREALRASLEALFARLGADVLVGPAVAFVAPAEDPAIEGDDGQGECLSSALANMTGHPAVSIPCGMSEGLPVGLHLIGRHGSDAALLSAAATIEACLGFHERPSFLTRTECRATRQTDPLA